MSELPPIKAFEENWQDTEKLFDLFRKENNGRRGRSGLGYLRKAMLVIMLSHWESYIEDEIMVLYDAKYGSIRKPDSLPDGFRHALEVHLKEEYGEKWGWEMAGSGWKKSARGYAQNRCDQLNTPSHKNIDRIMKTLFSVRKFSDGWRWQGIREGTSREKLDTIIKTRGAIAHGRKPVGRFDYNTIDGYKTFLWKLAQRTNYLFQEMHNS